MTIDPEMDSRVEQLTRGTDLGYVAGVLASQRDAILKRWLDAAVKQPFHAVHPEHAVADHIPDLFDALVGVLRRSAPPWVEIPAPLADALVLEAASAHARIRFEQGLHPDDVVTEFRLLRQEIGRALRSHLADAAPATDVIGAELVVHDALDGAIGLALAALTSHVTEVRDEFLATTAHDVQQPLTGIKGSIQLARRQLGQPSRNLDTIDHLLARAETEVDRLAALVRTLADVTRLSLGRLELETSTVNLADVIEDVVARLEPDAAARIRLNLVGQDYVGEWDRLALDRVVSNLLSNALKYSPETAPVEIAVTADQDFVHVGIHDDGIGLDADELTQLFRRYSRSRGAVEHQIQGVGLGLYLSREIVQAMAGDIWAESPGRGRGSTFHVRLPRTPPSPSRE